jgi:preprotein translocase subunit YajC
MAIAAEQAVAQQPSMLEMLVLPAVFILIMYFLIIRPQAKKQKDHLKLISELKAGDEVITSGGIIARIKSVADNFVSLDVGSNMTLKVVKSHVTAHTEKMIVKTKTEEKK